jgi:RimJ/RimL family protein N-acetyltransferase
MITSSRVTLTSISKSDITEEYLETLNNLDYMKYSRNSGVAHTFESQSKYISDFVHLDRFLYGIKDSGSGKLVGTINYYLDFSAMTIDLGFLVFENYQGKGYASEGLGLLLPYLRQQFPGMTAVIGTNRLNLAMHEIAKNHGFTLDEEHERNSETNVRFIYQFSKFDSSTNAFVPDLILHARRIGIVAYDAGGAEQIKWLLQNLTAEVLVFVDGPATHIFSNSDISYVNARDLQEVMGCDLLITGSGWMSDFELLAIKEAKARNLTCITILDHWINFFERFGNDPDGHPLLLAVTNHLALQIAKEKFPTTLIWLLPDAQILDFQTRLRNSIQNSDCVLVLLEPISTTNSEFAISGTQINFLLESAISMKKENGLRVVIIRPHPSSSYIPFIEKKLAEFPGELCLSDKNSLLDDLESSKIVLGLSTYALYISAMCGFETYSVFAGVHGHWTCNFPNILKLSSHPT